MWDAKRHCVLYVTPNSFKSLENPVAMLLGFWLLSCLVQVFVFFSMGIADDLGFLMISNSPTECICLKTHKSHFCTSLHVCEYA